MTEGLFAVPGAEQPQAPPVPPLRLRRIRLQGVGPDGARFDPLDLDFATEHGAASRVLLSLTNTGGKSTLITLVSSVIVPAARAQVGGKVLGDYVLTGDTAHVVCEWEDSTADERVVTGTVMEWRDGKRQPAHALRSTTNMHRSWYLFRTGDGLPGIDDLPFIVDERRTPYRDFCARLDDLVAANAGTRGVRTERQIDWTAALDERTSIDPVLFGYQMRMNDSEAGAQKLLESFTSPNEVIRFFVAALNDQRELESFTGTLEHYAQLAAQRAELEALASWGAQAAPLITRIAETAADAASATAVADKASALGGELAASLRNRVEEDRCAAEGLRGIVAGADAEAARARRAYGQVSDIRLQLQLDQARADVAQALKEHEQAKSVADAADRLEEAWKAVDLVIDLDQQRSEREAAQWAYEAADAGLGPLRDDVATATSRLAGRLTGLIAENAEAAAIADAAAGTAAAAIEAEMEKANAAAARVTALNADLEKISSAVTSAADACAAAEQLGWLLPDEHPDAGTRRWVDEWAEASRLAGVADRDADAAEAVYEQAAANLTTLEPRVAEKHTTMTRAKDRLTAIDDDIRLLIADPTVHEVHGGEPDDASAVQQWIASAGAAAATNDTAATRHQAAADHARTEIAHLDDHGTAPTGVDVQAVLDALKAARVWSVTGLQWIERNVADVEHRQAFITARPDIAGGVIISDPSRFDSAVAELGASPPRTRTPVTVTVAPASVHERHSDTDSEPFVVAPHRATWDRVWAEAYRAELDQTERKASLAAGTAATAAARYRRAAAECTAFTDRWSATPRVMLAENADTAVAEHAAAHGEAEDQRRARDEGYRRAKEQRAESDQFLKRATHARRATDYLEGVQKLVVAADAAVARRQGLLTERNRVREENTAAKKAVGDATRMWQDETRKATQYRSNLQPLEKELGQLAVDSPASDPGGSVDGLRTLWNALQKTLAEAESGMTEAKRLQDAVTAVGQATERLRPFSADARTRAAELSGTVEATTQSTRTDAVARAMQAARNTRKAELDAGSDLRRAQEAVTLAEPADDRQNHFDLVGTRWRWTTAEQIVDLLAQVEIYNAEMLTARDEAEWALSEAKELLGEMDKDIESIADTIDMWTHPTPANVEVYRGSREAARTEMRDCVRSYQEADRVAQIAVATRTSAFAVARAAATRSQLTVPAVVRVRELPDADLIGEAEQLATRVQAMTASAQADLGELDQHRAILRDNLQTLCREQRRLLREVSRYSSLPDGLGELSGQRAIKIGFDDAQDSEAAVRLAKRIDVWATEVDGDPKRARSTEVRVRWLADAVRDTVVDRSRAGAWNIEILKPSIDGHVIYCPPDRIPAEFSGGQVLTLAVLVYCALSRVRAAHRQGGVRPPGTLILDNPFGAASAEALIAMQHRLAGRSGVQLVCATGLHDPAVDAAFNGPGSVIVKLRNDGDIRRNMSYLTLRAAVVDGVDVIERATRGRSHSDTRNWVDATRYEVR